jgi:hypothetical protein
MTGTLYGVGTTLRISARLANERSSGVYDLLSITPLGAVGLSWAVVTACLYRNNTFSRLYRWLQGIYLGTALLLLIAITVLLFHWWSYSQSRPMFLQQPNEGVYALIGGLTLILLVIVALLF